MYSCIVSLWNGGDWWSSVWVSTQAHAAFKGVLFACLIYLLEAFRCWKTAFFLNLMLRQRWRIACLLKVSRFDIWKIDFLPWIRQYIWHRFYFALRIIIAFFRRRKREFDRERPFNKTFSPSRTIHFERCNSEVILNPFVGLLLIHNKYGLF